jgi:uncharacterized protein
MKLVKNISLAGDAGKLESIYNPTDDPTFLAVCCHPHPQHHGTMHNKVIAAAAKTLYELGGAVIRFNFRGVMASEGQYDHGTGEMDDVKTAIDFLLGEYARPLPLVVCGFSFGAWVGAKHTRRDERVSHFIGLGLPLRLFDLPSLETLTIPKLIIWGDRDEYNALDKIQSVLKTIAEPKDVFLIENADHFFAGKLETVQQHLTNWTERYVLESK